MKDSGVVISTSPGLAEVEVECLVEACASCPAKSLCSQRGPSKGHLTVRNPLSASVGDQVEIEIPERNYTRALILIFLTFLLSSLAGIGMASFLSRLLSFPRQELLILGFLLGLACAGIWLFRYFRKKNNALLYPVIITIIQKGEKHG